MVNNHTTDLGRGAVLALGHAVGRRLAAAAAEAARRSLLRLLHPRGRPASWELGTPGKLRPCRRSRQRLRSGAASAEAACQW